MLKKPWGEYKGFHHLYLGVIFQPIGFHVAFTQNITWGLIIVGLGIYLVIDDVVQHFWGKRTPCRRLNDWLYKNFKLYEILCSFWDRIFGKEK